MAEVMSRIKQVINKTAVPSWLNSVPHNYGDVGAGTIKADEWRNLSTIFLPLALISMWGEGTPHPSPEIATRFHHILDHTMTVVSAISLACMCTMTLRCSAAYLEYMTQYIHDFLILYPDIKPRPNMHMAMHHISYVFLAPFYPGGASLSNDSSVKSKGCSVTTNLVIYFLCY
jgi:hypothetical protein